MLKWLGQQSEKRKQKTRQLGEMGIHITPTLKWLSQRFGKNQKKPGQLQPREFSDDSVEQESAPQQVSSALLRSLLKTEIADAEQIADSIKMRAQKEAEVEAVRIIARAQLEVQEIKGRAEIDAQKRAEDIISAANSKAEIIEVEVKHKALQFLISAGEEVENEIREEYKRAYSRLSSFLQDLMNEGQNIEAELKGKVAKLRESKGFELKEYEARLLSTSEVDVPPIETSAPVETELKPDTASKEKVKKKSVQLQEETIAEKVKKKPVQLQEETIAEKIKKKPVQLQEETITEKIKKKPVQLQEEAIAEKVEELVQLQEETIAEKVEEPVQLQEETIAEKVEEPVQLQEETIAEKVKKKPVQLQEETIAEKVKKKPVQLQEETIAEKVEEPVQLQEETIAEKVEEPTLLKLDSQTIYTGEVELLIASLVELNLVSKLYNYLQTVPELKILYTRGSWDQGTTITVVPDKPMPLIDIILKTPGVAVTAESLEKDGLPTERASSPLRPEKKGVKRIKLILKEAQPL